MKKISTINFLILSTIFFTSIASAQPHPAYKVLTDLTPEQVTQIKQLGRISSNDSINPIYDTKLERILTPEQNKQYRALRYGPKQAVNTENFNFNMDSK